MRSSGRGRGRGLLLAGASAEPEGDGDESDDDETFHDVMFSLLSMPVGNGAEGIGLLPSLTTEIFRLMTMQSESDRQSGQTSHEPAGYLL